MAYEFNNDDHFDMKSQMMVGNRTETDSVRYAGREGAAFGTTPIGYLSILPYPVIPDMNSESA